MARTRQRRLARDAVFGVGARFIALMPLSQPPVWHWQPRCQWPPAIPGQSPLAGVDWPRGARGSRAWRERASKD